MNPLPLLLMSLASLWQAGEPVRLPVVADTSLQVHPSEIKCNSGAASSLRVKGNEHYLLLKFDLGPIAGWQVRKATLYLHDSHPNKLRTVGLSTLAADWQEGTGSGGPATDGCTFTHAVWPDTLWAGPGSDFLDVALTHGNTLVRYTDIQPVADGWFTVDVDPVLVHAMLTGGSYGLCVSDEKGQTAANNDVHSREQRAFAPYLMVEGGPLTPALPPAPTLGAVGAEPWPAAATFTAGAARLKLTSPGGSRYLVTYRQEPDPAQTLPLYLTPRPLPAGHDQTIVLPGLKPGVSVSARVAVMNEFGQRSAEQSATAVASPAKALPEPLALQPATPTPGQEPPEGDGLRIWACPAECKVNPVTGAVLEEATAGAFRRANPVWDGGAVRLRAGRGELLAVQVIVESATPDAARQISVKYTPAAGRRLPAPVGIYRNWYVNDKGWWAEYLVPLAEGAGFSLPAADNAVPGQRNQALTVVWEIPRDQPPGEAQAELTVADNLRLPLTVNVVNVELPAQTSFEVDLNCYGPVKGEANWEAYLAAERQYFAAAHQLRCTLNSLGYSQSGKMSPGYAPQIAGVGADVKATDWAQYDQHFGPYLDGSAFTGVRAGVPLTHMYLPLHENWPLPIADHYRAGNDLRKYPDNIIAHALTAPVIEAAFDEAYGQAFSAMTGQFVQHFRDRGWRETDLQCYLNDKYYYKDEKSGFRGTSWWLLDEPSHRDDWLALRYYARLFRQGVGERTDPLARRFQFRGDISRPQWQRDWLDGLVDNMCVAGALFEHPEHCRRFREQGVTLWHYGEANPIAASNLTGVAWALKAWCGGADGILPWNSIGGGGALTTPTPTALLIPGERFGLTGPLVSLRLLALCRGQQDVEYLNQLARRRGLDRDQMARLVGDTLNLSGRQRQDYADDAGRVLFDRLRAEDFAALRQGVLAALEG